MARFIFNRFRVEASEKIENKLQFMLDGMTTDTGLLIFEEVPNLISKNTFISRFKELFIENHKEKRTVLINISGIVEQYSFLERVKDFKKIEKITLNLVPSNPHFADRWEIVDERFR